MGEYKPATCAYCNEDSWCETRANGKPQCRACKVERFFSEILYPPLGYVLIGWQREVIRGIYGNPDPITGLRAYRSAYISVGKKNGKSFLIGGLPLYHLTMEDEVRPAAYGAAASKEQAAIVYNAALSLLRANRDLLARLRPMTSTKRILRRDGNGFYAVVSADGKLQDGVEPSLLIRDEVHRWTAAGAATLKDVLTKGQISRREPLDIAITTAGAQYESQLWFNEYQHAKAVQANPMPSGSHFVAIWEADRKRVETEPDYWKSKEARLAANPSHEDFVDAKTGRHGFLRDSAIRAELDKAIADPSERSKYLRYHLNVPIAQEEDPIVNMDKWSQCGGGVNLQDWPTYDYELLIRQWGLIGRPCYCGVDASWSTDVTALVFVFPPFEDVKEWTYLPFFWLPEKRLADIERACKVPMQMWADHGFLELTEGTGIDLVKIIERILWGSTAFDLLEVDFDKLNFRTEAMRLRDVHGIKVVEVTQIFLNLSHATKFFLSAYEAQRVRHGNHPMFNWMASCLQLQYDKKDNCQPIKPTRYKSAARIDGCSATVTALSRALLPEENSITYSEVRSV